VVDDVDLLHAGAEARERVDEPLQAVVALDDLLRRPLRQRVRLVVEHERPPAIDVQDVEAAVQEHAVVLEGERPLGPRAGERRDPGGEGRAAVRRHERLDPLELLLGDGRVPGTHLLDARRDGRGQIDQLEQPVHSVADLRRRETVCAWDGPVRLGGAHARDALSVVAVGAAVEERERAVGEPAHVV
jgi:hypothetical protein